MNEAREMSGNGDSFDTEEYMNFETVIQNNPELARKAEEFIRMKHPELINPNPVNMPDINIEQMMAEIKAQFPELAEYAASCEIPTDPAVISKLFLFVECKEEDDYFYEGGYETTGDEEGSEDVEEKPVEPVRTGLKRYSYDACIKGDKVKIPLELSVSQFPIYSEKREKQLREQSMKALNR